MTTTTGTPVTCRCGAAITWGYLPGYSAGRWMPPTSKRLDDSWCADGSLHAPVDAEFPATWAAGHALVTERCGETITASCQCGEPFGRGNPASLGHVGLMWEQHIEREESR